MIAKKAITMLLLFLFSHSFAQWQEFTVPISNTEDLNGIDFVNNTTFFICSNNNVSKTTTSGATWQSTPVSGLFFINKLKAIKFSSPNFGILTGIFNLTNDEIILSTSNSGNSWNTTYTNTPSNPLNFFNEIDMVGNNVLICGTKGRILKSINGGNTYVTKTSSVNKELHDIKYITPSKIICVGNNVLLRSYDGGNTWFNDTAYSTFLLNSISIPNTGVVYVSDVNGHLFKSVNSGNSFTTINTSFNITSMVVANSDTVFIGTNNGVYVSFDSGNTWEQFKSTQNKFVNKLEINNNKIYALCKNAKLLVLDLNTIASEPIARFSVSETSICPGDSILLNNSTFQLPNYSYQWKLNDSLLDTQYNTGLKLNVSGTYTVSLIVNNGSGVDTTITQVEVVGHGQDQSVLIASSDTVCKGATVDFLIQNSQIGTIYQLRKGFTKIGAAQVGNGGILYFSSILGLNGITSYNMKAERTNACYIDSFMQYKTIYIDSGELVTSCTPQYDYCPNAGITSVSFKDINNASFIGVNYFDYSCCKSTDVTIGGVYPISITTAYHSGEYVKVWIDYDNNGIFNNISELAFSGFSNGILSGNINISATTQVLNQKIRMRVASDISSNGLNNACYSFYYGQIEDYAITIVPDTIIPTANFDYTLISTCSTTVSFSNDSYNATSYKWDFGDLTTSVLPNPTHVYSTTGTYFVKLLASNAIGTDTLIKVLTVQIPNVPIPAICQPSLLPCSSRDFIQSFTLNGYHKASSSNFHEDFTCESQIYLVQDSAYYLQLTLENTSTGNSGGKACVWIDYNNDGSFNQTNEMISLGNISANIINIYFTVPNNTLVNTPLRLRVLSNNTYIGSACSSICGSYEDYSIYIVPFLPVNVDFSIDSTSFCINDTVNFKNSTKNATNYLWDFGDGTTSNLFNPKHLYNTSGTYTIKLRACNNNSCDSLIRTSYVTINSLPIINTFQDPTVCENEPAMLKASGGVIYVWDPISLNGSSIIISPSATTIYTVTCINAYGCSNISTVTLTKLPLPLKPIISLTDTLMLCQGDSVVLSTNVTSNFSWSNGATTQSIMVHNTGLYSVSETDNNGCSSTSLPTTVLVNPPPTKPVIYAGDTIVFCQGDQITLSTNVTSNFSWSNGLTTQNIIVSNSGLYSVTAIDSNGCLSTSLPTNVLTYPIPTAPIITANDTVLTSNSAIGNQWYLNGNLIIGATSKNYVVTQDGNYTVVYTDTNGCSSIASNIYNYMSIGIKETINSEFKQLKIYPNPSSGIITLIYSLSIPSAISIELFDIFGKKIKTILSLDQIQVIGTYYLNVDIRELRKGIYYFKETLTDKSFVERFILSQ